MCAQVRRAGAFDGLMPSHAFRLPGRPRPCLAVETRRFACLGTAEPNGDVLLRLGRKQSKDVVVAVLLRTDEQIERLEKRAARDDERIAQLERLTAELIDSGSGADGGR